MTHDLLRDAFQPPLTHVRFLMATQHDQIDVLQRAVEGSVGEAVPKAISISVGRSREIFRVNWQGLSRDSWRPQPSPVQWP